MKKLVLFLATALFLVTNTHAFEVSLLANNKEANSKELTRRDLQYLNGWLKHHHFQNEELKKEALKVLETTIQKEVRVDTSCDLGISSSLEQEAQKSGLIADSGEMGMFIIYLRNEDLIDDLLYRILKDANLVNQEISHKAGLQTSLPRVNTNLRTIKEVNIETFFAPVKKWPDDLTNCSLDTYFRMTNNLTWKTKKSRDLQMQALNALALKNNVINRETFNKLEIFRIRGVIDWKLYFKRYADIVNNSKDKLTETPESQTEHIFSETYVSRKNKITHRGRLYMTYNSTQVMMLAQIIEKTAKRIDATQVTLRFDYGNGTTSESEIYIFSPLEQYRAAIKMLKKEIAEILRSDSFRTSGLQYADLIAAAYETGFIKSNELDYVLKFEDFWNPKTPRWKSYANFTFSLAGTAAVYLPPPWNIIGAIGLVLSQSKLIKSDQDPNEDDNWNVII